MSVGIGANAFKATLAQALNAGGSETTVYLDTIQTLTGETLTTADFAVFGKGTLTVNPLNSGSMEFSSFTAVDSSNIALTGLIRGLSAFDSTASTSRAFYHPVGTTVIIAFGVHDLQNFKTYVDGLIAGTIGNASTSTSGVTKLSTAPVSPSSPIAVGDNDLRIPTATQTLYLATVSQIGLYYAADSVGTDSYAITLSPAPAAYTTGLTVNFKAGTANTGAATLKINSLAAITIKKKFNSDLTTGDILAGQIVTVVYDGTNWQLTSPSSAAITFANGTITKDIGNSTSVTIAHGMGVTPKKFRVTGLFCAGSSAAIMIAMMSYNATSGESSINAAMSGGTGTGGSAASSCTFNDPATGGFCQLSFSSMDATNIILSASKAGTISGTAQLMWEAEA